MQPTWRLVAELGDVSFEHESIRLFVDETGECSPALQYIIPLGEDESDGYHLAWVSVDPCDGTEWFFSELNSVANYVGVDRIDLGQALLERELSGVQAWSEKSGIVRRAMAYRDLIAYHGMINFDSYPVKISHAEAEKRHDAASLTAYAGE